MNKSVAVRAASGLWSNKARRSNARYSANVAQELTSSKLMTDATQSNESGFANQGKSGWKVVVPSVTE